MEYGWNYLDGVVFGVWYKLKIKTYYIEIRNSCHTTPKTLWFTGHLNYQTKSLPISPSHFRFFTPFNNNSEHSTIVLFLRCSLDLLEWMCDVLHHWLSMVIWIESEFIYWSNVLILIRFDGWQLIPSIRLHPFHLSMFGNEFLCKMILKFNKSINYSPDQTRAFYNK